MSKFKVGDKVTLKPREPGWEDIRPFYTDDMVDDCESGRVFVICRDRARYVDLGLWLVQPEWIEHAPVSLDNV